MMLTQPEIEQFYKLWYTLVWGINERHEVIPRFKRPVYGTQVTVNIEEFSKIRSAMWDNPEWIDEFLAGRGNDEFDEQEREIVEGWRRHFVKGRFFVLKHLKKYSVLMTFEGEPTLLYGVHGISDSIEGTMPYPVPFLVDLVLIPFKDKIIYDSLASVTNIRFGPGYRSAAKEWYDEAKKKYGIIEALNGITPFPRLPAEKQEKKPVKAKIASSDNTAVLPKGVNVPKAMAARYVEIAKIIEQFSDEKLNDEYKDICLRALQKLCRKRPSPLAVGKAYTWACSIVYAIGRINFIFDKSQPINMTAADIADWFGLAKSTAGNKAAEIIKLLNLSYFNTEFLLKALIDDNSAIWMMRVNGFFTDIRMMSREIQEEAFYKGLIPYIPEDKE